MKIVDNNEPWAMREQLLIAGWECCSLAAGDYSFPDHDGKLIGIERKEVGDLLNSIGNKLDNQLERMLDNYPECILLLEGSWRTIADKVVTEQGITNWHMSTIWNYLQSWQRKGITLELTSGIPHTIRRLNELYAYYQKPFHFGGVNGHSFPDDRILAFPSSCRGKTALAVLEGRSLATISQMSPQELERIPGIGKVKAQAIANHFGKIK